jgi:hypothetical protein
MKSTFGKVNVTSPSEFSYIRSFVDNALAQAKPFLISAALNAEYIRGNQNIRVTKGLSIEPVPKQPKQYKERKVFNRINPIYLARYGILSDNMPIPGYKSVNFTIGRYNNYAEGNKFITDYMTDENFKQNIYNRLIKITDIGGIGWLKSGIDWTAGKDIGSYDIEVEDPDTKEKKKYKNKISEGRPFLEVVPHDQVLVNNYFINHINEVDELVHRRPFTLEYIKKRWGIEATPEVFDAKGNSPIGRITPSSQTGISKPQYAYVYEYYQKASAVYPDGLFVIFVGDKKVYEGKLPFVNSMDNKRKIPFDLVRMQSIPNYLYGMTVYSQIIPIQDTFNQIKNRYLEYVNHTAIGQLYVWENSLVDSGISTTPGLMVRLKRNSKKPEPVQKEKLGVELLQFLRMLEEDMLTSAGLSQLSAYGQGKSNMRTDGVVNKIAESDQNKLVDAIDSLSEGIVSAFKKVLYLELHRQEILKDELKVAKIDDYVIKYKLDEVDIEQLTIVNREFLMQNDQLVDKKFQQLAALGVYNPQMGLSYISKIQILDTLGTNSLKETLDPTETYTHELVEEEHLMMLNNELDPGVEEWHLHQQHIFEHNLFRISKKVRDLKRTDPEAYKVLMELLDNHIKGHQELSQESGSSYANAKAMMSTAPRAKG